MDNKKMVLNHFNQVAENDYYLNVLKRREKYNNVVDSLVMRFFAQTYNPTILDAGCGMGQRAAKYKTAISGSRVYGMDISPKMIEHAKKYPLDSVYCGDIINIPFEHNYFDYVSCLFFVFCYLTSKQDRIQALNEFYRVLKPDGKLFIDVISVIHKGEEDEFKRSIFNILFDKYSHVFKRGFNKGDKIYKVSYDNKISFNYFHAFENNEMVEIIKKSGFLLKEKAIIGYDSGKRYDNKYKGQYLYVLEKER